MSEIYVRAPLLNLTRIFVFFGLTQISVAFALDQPTLTIFTMPKDYTNSEYCQQNQMFTNSCWTNLKELSEASLKDLFEMGKGNDDNLESAHLAWKEYRDKECSRRAAPYAAGSIYPLIIDQCVATLNSQKAFQYHVEFLGKCDGGCPYKDEIDFINGKFIINN